MGSAIYSLMAVIMSFIIWQFYISSINQTFEQLSALVKSQKHLIESVARFDAAFSAVDNDTGSLGATLSQVREAHNRSSGEFGETGEFVMAHLENNSLIFLHQRLADKPIIKGAKLIAEPMRLALAGKEGTIQAKDYRGEIVLAAFEPVHIGNKIFGLVAKVDLMEIQWPFIRMSIIGLVTLLVSLVIIFFSFWEKEQSLDKKEKKKEKRKEKLSVDISGWRSPQVVIILLIGLVVTVSVGKTYSELMLSEDLRSFERYVDADISNIQEEIDRNLSIIKHIKSFYAASEAISREEFSTYVNSVIQMEGGKSKLGMQAVEWIPRVSDDERLAYEMRAHDDGLSLFSITERKNRRIVPAAKREEYYPVYFVEPLEGNEAAIGFDLASNKERLTAMNRAIESAELVATSPIQLVQENESSVGFLAFLAIYQGEPKTVEARRKQVEGFALGVFKVEDIINLAILKNSSDKVEFEFFDKGLNGDKLLYASKFETLKKRSYKNNSLFEINRELSLAGRLWKIKALPGQTFINQVQHHWSNLFVLVIGGMLTLLIALQFKKSAVKQAGIERVVSQRTIQLRDSQAQFLSFMKHSPNLTFIINSDNEYEFVSDSWLDYFDKAKEDVLGKHLNDVFSPGLARYFVLQNTVLLNNGDPVTSEDYADAGQIFLTHRFLIHRHGKAPLIGGSSVDISKQKEIEKELQQLNLLLEHRVKERTAELEDKQEKLRAIIENTVDGIIVIDEEGTIGEFSPSAEKTFGYSRSEAVGQNIKIIVPDNEQENHPTYINNFLNTGEKKIIGAGRELVGKRKDGELFPLDLAVSVAEVKGKKAFVGMTRDITDRKREEQELVEARDSAQAANRAKSDFLAAMSHELRTPMNGVIGVMDLLWETELASEQRRLVKTSKESAFSLLTIINDILDFSKIEAGKLELESIPLSIAELVEGVADTLFPGAEEKKIRLDIYIDPAIPENLIGDPVRIRQVLFNLAGNAIKFTNSEERKGVVEIRADYKADFFDQTVILLNVSDNGIGISEKARTTLFKPFTQAEQSTTRRFGGTGLGLTITKKITDIMNGNIQLVSQEGAGSCFTVSLPCDQDKEKITSEVADFSDFSFILLSDDDYTIEIIQHYVEFYGGVLQRAGSTTQAAKMLDGITNSILIIGLEYREAGEQLYSQINNEEIGLNSHFLFLSNDRNEKMGLIESERYIIQDRPILRSHLIKAISVLSGKQSDTNRGFDDGSDEKPAQLLTIEEAIKANSLVLLVEDNEVNRDIIGLQLNNLGYTVEMTCDGVEGFEQWKTGRYALVLSDCHMPEMDGLEMTAAIRKWEKQQGLEPINIIAVTANALAGEARRCIDAGMNDYISKPVELKVLKSMMDKWLPHSIIEDDLSESDKSDLNNETESPSTEKVKESPPLDISVLAALVGDVHDIHCQLLVKFVTSSTDTIEQINQAFEDKDGTALSGLGHKLKSSARSIGGAELGRLSEQLEVDAKECDWLQLELLIKALISNWRLVCKHITQYYAK